MSVSESLVAALLDVVGSPTVLFYLVAGVLIGLAVGLLPGLGGPAALAVMIPLTFDLPTLAALAMLLGMLAVTSTAGDVTAILFGIPGEPTSAALVLDGHAMSKSGHPARAVALSLSSSLVGALLGVVAIAASVPFIRPLILSFASPELFALSVAGVAFMAVLSGGAILKGLITGVLGMLLAMIGLSPQLGVARYTFGSLDLWDGLGLVAIAVGLFAIPELVDLAIMHGRAKPESVKVRMRHVAGYLLEPFRYWGVLLRGAITGVIVGVIPGLGGSVAQWAAYGQAVGPSSRPGRREPSVPLGKGRAEGIIAPGAANNAKEGASLIPTIAFGVPGSVSMAVLLGGLILHGLTPGPGMLSKDLQLSLSFVWIIAIANFVAVLLILLLIGPITRVTRVPASAIIPVVLAFVLVGAFAEKGAMIDVTLVIVSGIIGFVMQRLGWPRPPLLLGLVLGGLIERYMFLSVTAYGSEWVQRPIALGILLVTLGALAVWGLRGGHKKGAFHGPVSGPGPGNVGDVSASDPVVPNNDRRAVRLLMSDTKRWDIGFSTGVTVIAVGMVLMANDWPGPARLVPTVLGASVALLAGLQTVLLIVNRRSGADPSPFLFREEVRPTASIVLWTLIFWAAIGVTGFLVGCTAVATACCAIESRRRWPQVAMVGLTVLVTLLALRELLGIPLYGGLIGAW